MMINEPKKYLILFSVVVLLLGIGLYRLYQQGRLPKFELPTGSSIIQDNRTQTLVTEENAIIDTVEKSAGSVIAIGVNQRIVNPFSPFSGSGRTQDQTIGTGFVVSDKNIIVTNRHVVSDPNMKYTVVTKDGKKLEVTKIYRDPTLDLALVQVSDLQGLKPLELGDSSKLKVGQIAIAIGNALGRFDNTVTTGVVSGVGRTVSAGDPFSGETERLDNLIQTDAAINPGNSGGPLLNSAGQVIGVNVATTEGAQNIGFTIPINAVKALVEEFSRTGNISRAYLGVRYRLVTRDVAIMNEVPQGAYIQEIIEGSPAEKAGIQIGDIITKIDGQTVNADKTISDVITAKKSGNTVSLEVWTDGNTKTVTATLEESPNQ